jgi:uncharacterized membrane protein
VTEENFSHPAAAAIAGVSVLQRMGKLRARKHARHTERRETPTRRPRINPVTTLLKAVFFVGLLVVYLVAEVLIAMLAYMYLNIYQFETFGRLIGLSRELLNMFATQLERFSPELATQANATILGELGAKSVLLLFIGLGVSALIRLFGAFLHRSFETVRRPQKAG